MLWYTERMKAHLFLLATLSLHAIAADRFLLTVEGQRLEFAPPEIVSLDEERAVPGSWSRAWSEQEIWPGTWSVFPRYDEDGSIILGGAFRQVVPGSVKVTSLDGDRVYREGEDFRVNYEWGNVAGIAERLGTGTLRFQAKFALQRIDLVQRTESGEVQIKRGISRKVSPMIPDADAGCVPLCGVYIAPWERGGCYRLLEEDVYPIDAERAQPVAPVRPEAVARTLAKLRAGAPVKIAFLGDSITLGAEAGPWWKDTSTTWRGRTLRGLRERFPKSEITEIEAFQGGRGIAFGLDVLEQKVLPERPDLAFVMLGINDCHKPLRAEHPRTPLSEYIPAFAELISRCQGAGIEVIILSSMETNPLDANGDASRWEGYRLAMKHTAELTRVGYGDTYEEWQRLRYRGIPPFSQLHNWINHPGAWGHAIFSDMALRFFPAE